MDQVQKRSFPLGQVVITSNANETLNRIDVYAAMRRHSCGDWGDCTPGDAKVNEVSLREGFRILSVYSDRYGTKYRIITEADRSATTVLLPEDYQQRSNSHNLGGNQNDLEIERSEHLRGSHAASA